MRWLAVLLLMVIGGNPCRAQSQPITLSVENRPLKEVMNKIEKESNLIFIYQSGTIDLNRKVSVHAVKNSCLRFSMKSSPLQEWNGASTTGRFP